MMEFEEYEKQRKEFVSTVSEYLATIANSYQKERNVHPSALANWMVGLVFQMCFESIEKSGYAPLKIAILKSLNIHFDYYKEREEDDEEKESP